MDRDRYKYIQKRIEMQQRADNMHYACRIQNPFTETEHIKKIYVNVS